MGREVALKVKKLKVTFGGLVAVNSVSFKVKKNEIHSLIGPNGAGKTTIFNALTGFLSKSQGTIEFNGQTLHNLKPHQIAQKGLVKTFQQTSLFPNLSVTDNIRTACHLREKVNIFEAIFNTRQNRLTEDQTSKTTNEIINFIKLDNKVELLARNLPYGDQRILEIGIALAAGPKMLLLDEPSAGLNNTETQAMMRLIKKTRDIGMTILLVEHDMRLVMRISDRITVLNFGEKIAEGTPDEIKCNPEVITAYLGKERGYA
jgi:branched-chain amino acid transport system ATP-binding protein